MKKFKSKIVAYGLMVVFAAAAPMVMAVSCPRIEVICADGGGRTCSGTSNGSGGCVYKESCLSCG